MKKHLIVEEETHREIKTYSARNGKTIDEGLKKLLKQEDEDGCRK